MSEVEATKAGPPREKKQFKKHWPKKKKHSSFKKMPKDDEEREELKNEVVDHVNLTRNRTKTLKHFMTQGYPNFLIRRLMGDLFKNPNPEKTPFIVDPEKKNTLKNELAVFMMETKLDKKEQSDQLKMLVKHFKPKGYSKGQVRSALHQFTVRMMRRGKPKKLGLNKPSSSPDQKDSSSPNGSDSGVENIEPTSSVLDYSDVNSPKRKSLNRISTSPSKVSKITPREGALTPKEKVNQNKMQMSAKKMSQKKMALTQSPSNKVIQVSTVSQSLPSAENLSPESISTPKEYPKTPDGYINRKTMRKLKREAFEAAKAGKTPILLSTDTGSAVKETGSSPLQASPFKESFTPTIIKAVHVTPEKIEAPTVPTIIASPKLETSEHPLNEKDVKVGRSPSPLKQSSPLKKLTPTAAVQSPAKQTPVAVTPGPKDSPVVTKRTPSPSKQASPKKSTLKSSLKKKGLKNQVANNDTPKEEKRVSFGKNQIKEFNRNQTPNVSKAINHRETDLIKFTPVKNLISFETPAKQVVKEQPHENQADDDCPQLISVLDEPTPELKAANGTPVEPMVPKKKKTPPKFSPRMTRSAAKKKAAGPK